MFICPICQSALSQKGRTFACVNNHTFDLSKSGHLNLKRQGKGLSGAVGDSRPMLEARRIFLRQGHYRCLTDELLKFLKSKLNLRQKHSFTYADLGCGEGFYTDLLSTELASLLPENSLNVFGFDVSKEAVIMASKAYREHRFVVNDTHHGIPLAAASVDLITNVFAPRNFPEFHRVLSPSGILLIIVPGQRHLEELRQRYSGIGIQTDKRQYLLEQAQGFEEIFQQKIERQTILSAEQVRQLLQMTPLARHIQSTEVPVEAEQITFSFEILAFKRA